MDISQKIRELIEYKKSNFSKFGKMIGKSDVSVRKNATGASKPNFEMLHSILQAFPEISAEWLLRDEGPMLRNRYELTPANSDQVRELTPDYGKNYQTELLECHKKIIALQDELNAMQKQLFETKLQKQNILKTDK